MEVKQAKKAKAKTNGVQDLRYRFIRILQQSETRKRSHAWEKDAADWMAKSLISLELLLDR